MFKAVTPRVAGRLRRPRRSSRAAPTGWRLPCTADTAVTSDARRRLCGLAFRQRQLEQTDNPKIVRNIQYRLTIDVGYLNQAVVKDDVISSSRTDIPRSRIQILDAGNAGLAKDLCRGRRIARKILISGYRLRKSLIDR